MPHFGLLEKIEARDGYFGAKNLGRLLPMGTKSIWVWVKRYGVFPAHPAEVKLRQPEIDCWHRDDHTSHRQISDLVLMNASMNVSPSIHMPVECHWWWSMSDPWSSLNWLDLFAKHVTIELHISRVVNEPYRSLCLSQCKYSSSPGLGRSSRFPIRNLGFGPGGRACRFWGNKMTLTIYIPRMARMGLMMKAKAIVDLED
jgi:hypothetical protein